MELQVKDNAIKIIKMTNGNICNRCLGRNFSKSLEGDGNLVRGENLRNASKIQIKIIQKILHVTYARRLFT